MIDPFECKGRWRMPPQRKWIDGVLKYSVQSGATLELFGSFTNSSFDNITKPIIVGNTNAGEITLIDSRPNGNSAHYPTNTILSNYDPAIIIKGSKMVDAKKIQFQKVSFRLFNLFDWLDTKGLDLNTKNMPDYDLHFRNPPNVKFSFGSDSTGGIEYASTLRIAQCNNEISFNEYCTITFEYSKALPYNEILKDIVTFQGFITVNIYEQTYPTKITFWKKDKELECVFRHTAYSEKHKGRSRGEYFINYQDIAPQFTELLTKWFRFHNEVDAVTERLRVAFKDKLSFSVTKFMDVIGAIEVFHRRTQNNQRLPQDQFEDFMTRIESTELKEDEKRLLKDMLQFNEPPLRRRLNELIDLYGKDYISQRVTKTKTFINQVLDSRNYYTHYSKSLEEKALQHTELYECTQILLGLLIACVYQYIGVDKAIIDKGLQNRFHFGAAQQKNKLGQVIRKR